MNEKEAKKEFKNKFLTILSISMLVLAFVTLVCSLNNRIEKNKENADMSIFTKAMYDGTCKEVSDGIFVISISASENLVAIKNIDGNYTFYHQRLSQTVHCLTLAVEDGGTVVVPIE